MLITVMPLSECRGAQGIDRLIAGAGNGSVGCFGIDFILPCDNHVTNYVTGLQGRENCGGISTSCLNRILESYTLS